MNKYQEALNKITKTADKNETLQSDLECFYKLQELVNKETPMKPKLMNCGKCNTRLGDNNGWTQAIVKYCPNCGKKVDWSKE